MFDPFYGSPLGRAFLSRTSPYLFTLWLFAFSEAEFPLGAEAPVAHLVLGGQGLVSGLAAHSLPSALAWESCFGRERGEEGEDHGETELFFPQW